MRVFLWAIVVNALFAVIRLMAGAFSEVEEIKGADILAAFFTVCLGGWAMWLLGSA